MSRPAFVLAALALLAAGPVCAQEFPGGQPGRLLTLRSASPGQLGLGGCRLSQTNVVVGVNRALGQGSRAGQRLGSIAPGGCQPLVSTGIVAGVNLGLGTGSTADQTVEAVTPRGTLATTTFTRGVNIAGNAAIARQRLLNLVEP